MAELELIEVDGKLRPTTNSLGHRIHPEDEAIRNFWRWFDGSQVADELGRPVVVYHGTGNLENMDAFDPKLTGKGNDQIGSGFYFTTSTEEASAYTSAMSANAGAEVKLGGNDAPGVVAVYLRILDPIAVEGHNLRDSRVDVTHRQALAIMKRASHIYDLDLTPMGDWVDVWAAGKVTDQMLSDVARHYTGPSLIHLENDFFKNDAPAFRKALRDILMHDGATINFDDKTHWVAWFPEQIKSALGNSGEFNPDSSSLVDERVTYSPRLQREMR